LPLGWLDGAEAAARAALRGALAHAIMAAMVQGRVHRVVSPRLLWLAASVLCVLFWAAVFYLLLAR
jgi:hypothetical protein